LSGLSPAAPPSLIKIDSTLDWMSPGFFSPPKVIQGDLPHPQLRGGFFLSLCTRCGNGGKSGGGDGGASNGMRIFRIGIGSGDDSGIGSGDDSGIGGGGGKGGDGGASNGVRIFRFALYPVLPIPLSSAWLL
jgi:hypothetical protein